MPNGPKVTAKKLKALIDGWETGAPNDSFAGMTLDQFKTKVKPSADTRALIASLEAQMIVALDRRDDADKETRRLMQLVVNGIKGDINHGDDSPLYETVGYVRKSERKTGKTNKTKKPATAAPPVP